jgi:hypothetical protein
LTHVHVNSPLAEAENASPAIDGFREGPGLVEVGRPVLRFLREWKVRPLSHWQVQLEAAGWERWKASAIIRFATLCWYAAGGLFIALMFGVGFYLGGLWLL